MDGNRYGDCYYRFGIYLPLTPLARLRHRQSVVQFFYLVAVSITLLPYFCCSKYFFYRQATVFGRARSCVSHVHTSATIHPLQAVVFSITPIPSTIDLTEGYGRIVSLDRSL